MAIRLVDLAAERRTILIDTPLGNLKVTYAPHALTPNDAVRIAEAQGIESFRALMELLTKIILDWDLTGPLNRESDGAQLVTESTIIPIQKEILQHVPQSVLTLIYQRIQEDSRPKPRTSSTPSGPLYGDSGSFTQ